MTELSIIVLSYNTSDQTLACLNSLIKQYVLELGEKKFEIIVLDNSSDDESVSKIQKLIENNNKFQINLIENKKNVGFGAGNNIASSRAKGELLLFLNSDTEVLDKGLVGMIEYIKNHPKVAVLGGKLQSSNNSLQSSTGSFYTLPKLFLLLFGGGKLGLLRESPRKIKKVDWVSGALFMTRKDVFKKIGGFDENLFMYMEDMEICFRVKKEGYAVCFYPEVMVTHRNEGSSNRSFAVGSIYKGVLYFFKKHKSPLEFKIAKLLLVSKAVISIAVGKMTKNSYLVNTYKKAIQF